MNLIRLHPRSYQQTFWKTNPSGFNASAYLHTGNDNRKGRRRAGDPLRRDLIDEDPSAARRSDSYGKDTHETHASDDERHVQAIPSSKCSESKWGKRTTVIDLCFGSVSLERNSRE